MGGKKTKQDSDIGKPRRSLSVKRDSHVQRIIEGGVSRSASSWPGDPISRRIKTATILTARLENSQEEKGTAF